MKLKLFPQKRIPQFYHKLGTAQSEDILIYENKDFPLRNHYLFLDKKQNICSLRKAKALAEIHFGSVVHQSQMANGQNADGFEYEYGHITIKIFYIRTNDGAENNKLVSVDIKIQA